MFFGPAWFYMFFNSAKEPIKVLFIFKTTTLRLCNKILGEVELEILQVGTGMQTVGMDSGAKKGLLSFLF